MLGIAFDSWNFFDSIPIDTVPEDIIFEADAEIVNNPAFNPAKLPLFAVRNMIPVRLNRLILESSFKLQMDYLESAGKQAELFREAGIEKVMIDFDLPGILSDCSRQKMLLKILQPLKGIMYDNNIELELLVRLPFSGMDEFISHAALFRQKSMLGINYAIDLHIHEAGFDWDLLEEIPELKFDISTVNFIYDAALGNKINPQNLKKIIDYMKSEGSKCDFFLCPAGNINFQSVQSDIFQWTELNKTLKERGSL